MLKRPVFRANNRQRQSTTGIVPKGTFIQATRLRERETCFKAVWVWLPRRDLETGCKWSNEI